VHRGHLLRDHAIGTATETEIMMSGNAIMVAGGRRIGIGIVGEVIVETMIETATGTEIVMGIDEKEGINATINLYCHHLILLTRCKITVLIVQTD
jgi:hypothetical protein